MQRTGCARIVKLISQIWTFALDNPALLIVPTVGSVLSLAVVRIKTRKRRRFILLVTRRAAGG